MNKKYHFTYITTNLINDKQYVGDHSTYDLNCSHTKNYIGSGYVFKNAKLKYGKENFKREILEFFNTKQEAFEAQEKYIRLYETHVSQNGYNISWKGGHQSKSSVSDETKEKIRKTLLGVKFSKERCQKISKGKTGTKYSEERCEKQRQSMMGKNKGKKLSEEHKRKMSEIQKGRKLSEKTKIKMSESRKKWIKQNPDLMKAATKKRLKTIGNEYKEDES